MVLNRKLVRVLLFLVVLFVCATMANDLVAQCPMCKVAAETNLKSGGTAGKGLNKGILYMLTLPYILIGSLAYLWWKNKKANQTDDPARWN